MNDAVPGPILTIFGTRPEAIKLFPVVAALRARIGDRARTCVTAQHRQMLDQVLSIAGLVPDHDLNVMRDGQSLDELVARLVTGIGGVLDADRPSRVIVQGDTATAMAGALAAYHRKIPVAHVEAGLRSGNIYSPWPEEVNRKIIGAIADVHFAPTQMTADALRAENVPDSAIHVTGNTVIDALLATRAWLRDNPALAAGLDDVLARFAGKRIITVTTHRRENFGDGMAQIARALSRIADRPDVAIVFPVHLNPNVRQLMHDALGGRDNIALLEPIDYPHFVRLLSESYLVLTDSGGIQEEAPAFGKPVLVMRDTTERQEGIAAGTARLVGTDLEEIVTGATQLLDDEPVYSAMSRAHSPFGDGNSAELIASILV